METLTPDPALPRHAPARVAGRVAVLDGRKFHALDSTLKASRGARRLFNTGGARASVAASFRAVRNQTEMLAAALTPEDQAVQSMPDASPTKWHRAHTTWFIETVVLSPNRAGYQPFHPQFRYLFNSYYEAAGPRHPRSERGVLTRPTCEEIAKYRAHVDRHLLDFITRCCETAWTKAAPLIALGLHHEQQHQELLLTDILHAFSCNPLAPVYRADHYLGQNVPAPPPDWIYFPADDYEIGYGGGGFCFDNECPRHGVKLRSFAIASRPVTNGEWLAFMEDGGYRRPELWLSDGWSAVQQNQWAAPLYWKNAGGGWSRFSLRGDLSLDLHAAVSNISFYEADAYARWGGKRLPTEAEWEVAASTVPVCGNFIDSERFEPAGCGHDKGLQQMYGDVWEWTQIPYTPYPGFRPAAGAVAEYNGKFMVNQIVLRGGSCLTPGNHIRPTYRNFFYPHTRWQFAGLRLADDT